MLIIQHVHNANQETIDNLSLFVLLFFVLRMIADLVSAFGVCLHFLRCVYAEDLLYIHDKYKFKQTRIHKLALHTFCVYASDLNTSA